MRSGAAVGAADEHGRHLLPSVVRYTPDGEWKWATPARAAKRRPAQHHCVGQALYGPGPGRSGQPAAMPYQFVDAPGMVQLLTRARVKSPVEISADILRALKARAEASLGGELVGAVITVPAHLTTPSARPPGRRPAGWLKRAAPAQRTHRRRHRLRPG